MPDTLEGALAAGLVVLGSVTAWLGKRLFLDSVPKTDHDREVAELRGLVTQGVMLREELRREKDAALQKEQEKYEELAERYRLESARIAPLVDRALSRLMPEEQQRSLRGAGVTEKIQALEEGTRPLDLEEVRRVLAERGVRL